MDADRFETLLRSLSASPSRRGALGLLTGILLGGSFTLRADDAEAHNKLKKCKKIDDKDKRKRCIKKAKRHNATHAGAPSPPPVPVLAYACLGPFESRSTAGFPATTRFAQSFTAAQSGSLLQIQFETVKDGGSTGDYVVELLDFGADGRPTNTVLAQVTIPNASVPQGIQTLTASFSGPPLVAGTEYAAALSRPGGSGLQLTNRSGNDCAGSAFEQTPSGSGPFEELTDLGSPENGFDFVTSVTVLV